MNFVINTAVFFDSLQADAAISKIIPEIKRALIENPAARIEVSGHTDPSGGDAINDPLSQLRAERVKAYLQERDPIFVRLTAKGYGSRNPRFNNATPEGRSKNRRVEISLPPRIAALPEIIINHSIVNSENDANTTNDTASDTVYVYQPPPQPVVYEELRFEFDFDDDRLPAQALAQLNIAADTLAQILLHYPADSIEIAGHTDSVGKASYNEGLSIRRATTVRNYLQSRKTTPAGLFKRLKVVGYGERQPVADNRTEAGRRKNRRIEFKLNGKKINIRRPIT
ncbi:MAG: OmpA family protein [bacterium]